MEEIILKIGKGINWYGNNSAKANINQLLEAKDKLVTLNYNIAEEVAEAKRIYNYSYYIRKISISKSKNSYINQGHSATKSESIATEEQAEKLEQEINNESYALKIELLLRQSNKVVDAMQQRISVLKSELNNSKNLNVT